MQYEAQILKPTDKAADSTTSANLSRNNQEHEILKPDTIKQTSANATALLESTGELPTLSLNDNTKTPTDAVVNAPVSGTTNDATSSASDLTFNDLQYLNSAISALNGDAQTLSKNKSNTQDLAKVTSDEQALHTDELNYMHAAASSETFADYDSTMEANHAELKNIATGLWADGAKNDAADTTAYYPTSQYEKYFDSSVGTPPPKQPTNPTDPTDPTGPSLKNETSYTNMQNDTWNKNLIASQIGGKGINPDMQLSDSDGKLTATMSGGAYTDGLVSNTQKLNTSDNTVQLNYDVNVKPGSDLHCLETDAAITTGTQANGKTLTAMAASQFVMDPTNGTMEFDTSGTNHQWVDAVNDIPMPKDGTNMDVSMTVKLVGNNYEYTGLTVDGKSYAINPSVGDFAMTTIGPKGWTPNTIHTQVQQDLGSAGGSSTVTYNDIQVNQGNS